MVEDSAQTFNEMLRDRSRVTVRPISVDDVSRVAAFIGGLSAQSRHLLFLAGITELEDEELRRLCDPDFAHDMAYVAIDASETGGGLVGLGRYVHDAEGQAAELSIAVADAWQHRGLGSLLLRHLIDAARRHGIRRLYSVDSASNYRMRQLAIHLGFKTRTDPEDPRQVVFSLDLDGSSAAGRSA